ncbi:hypothetical protein [Terrimonas alba]|uniref:hypothetical protein n=1 Tax=Terrimonas alba TaxID=3349636 RepID=UPI0035F460B7
MQDKDILNFWSWFTKNASSLKSDNYDKTLLDKLDKTISNWGLVWEVGPGLLKENSLTISPNGDKELLNKASDIIDKAPRLDNWEFFNAKQPKENWYLATLVDKGFEIDASNWTYVLLKYEDGKIEILLKADSLANLDIETKELAADLILTNLLGEKLKIEKIDFIDIVDKFEDDKGVTELKYLPAHLSDKRYFN